MFTVFTSLLLVITAAVIVELKPIDSNDVGTSLGSTTGSLDEPQTTTPDYSPTVEGNRVILGLPDQLFSSSANLTLRLRDLVGDLIMRSAVRFAKLVRFVQPVFGNNLVIEIPKDME
ncbi:uncharacterized protein LOC129732217 [Wyeomyia smithii]|uniref:uncharacterized protein LOC129732217 n=1 Tax=Wyeomyia smithii TaxID=174621 RepID=UPI002467ECA2|nr:uncharacterized protein LOC129732217 [Wyeomyia smithii]